mmetsp:Transcript_7132/g.21757  ORF Transcript_7132/g.21757 Transcript_7132/m.21757 type:complete len:291 (+) Transcript_7132:193-1065(+)|eukprot:CAMPEP_0198735646 /NCGR_PEP_ID=MMETSP1475-20131203/61150_1 /TAXON_ID= ORGANISM="Unidentified sp., Strain CCMP1999" /NCGR_SAMPLE_ID=MMETSP1475 /ASSEMBLY_ACC=CAM_ASM_001111 /LENGTH=290 /DNA_ID=CAMNT_0044499343 /DNA_START=153 /DNA_END=1025 /DNA_ORIENTATION=+
MSHAAYSKTPLLLSIHGKDLINLDVVSQTDSFVVVKSARRDDAEMTVLGRTETIDNDLNPHFVKAFPLSFTCDEENMLFEFEFYDQDARTEELSRQDFIGSSKITLQEIYTAPDMAVKLTLRHVKYDFPGDCIIFLEPIPRLMPDKYVRFDFCMLAGGNGIHCIAISRKAVKFWKQIFRSRFQRDGDKRQLLSDLIPLDWLRAGQENPVLRFIVYQMKQNLIHSKTFGTQEGFNSGSEKALSKVEIPYAELTGRGQEFKSETNKNGFVILVNTGNDVREKVTTHTIMVQY